MLKIVIERYMGCQICPSKNFDIHWSFIIQNTNPNKDQIDAQTYTGEPDWSLFSKLRDQIDV